MAIKAKEFWEHLCGKLDYRLFAGVPCLGLVPLYNTMDKNVMHYIPTVNEKISMSIVSGVWLTGIKGGVLISSEAIIGLGNEIKAIKDFNIPMLMVVASGAEKITYPFWHIELTDNFKTELDKIAKRNKPSILIVKEGVLV